MDEPKAFPSDLRSFGRIRSRAIKPRRQGLMETLLPKVALPDPKAGPLDVGLFARPEQSLSLEIGFGGGEHLAAQALRAPGAVFIGAEPFHNGVASALRHMEDHGLQNVRLHMGDARDVIRALPDGRLDAVFMLFPDPWPKARHHKRRLIQPDVLHAIGRVLAPGGLFRFATDWEDYGAWTLDLALRTGLFTWTATCADDWRTPFPDHAPTRYEAKGLGDIKPMYLEFRRR